MRALLLIAAALVATGCAYMRYSADMALYCDQWDHAIHLPGFAEDFGAEPAPPECLAYWTRGQGSTAWVDTDARWVTVHDVATGQSRRVFAAPGDYVVK